MKVVVAFPPNYQAVNDRFAVRGKPVIFCYGDTIFNPARVVVGPDLLKHETVHSVRQAAFAGGVAAWWDRYLVDDLFRLDEELPAHRAEYKYWCERADAEKPVKGFRTARDYHLLAIARRISSPLYGSIVSLGRARDLIAA